jgi:hypothetical protein
MKRRSPLPVAAALVVTPLVAALVAAGTGGAKAAGNAKPATDRRDAELACFDDAAKCLRVRPPGPALLRAGL